MAMTDDDPTIIMSPLSQRFTADGITVSVEIYRLETSEGWSLELVDEGGNSTVWEDVFPIDQAAWDVFKLGVQEYGLARLIQRDDNPPNTVH
jgi:hypothetical protein